MNQKAILVSLISVMALVYLTSLVSAGLVSGGLDVSVNGIEVTEDGVTTIGAFAGENIPIRVVFTADENADDVRLKAWIGGYRSDVEDETSRFNTISGSTYSKLLSLDLPDDLDPAEEFTLYLRVESKTQSHEENFDLLIQRESYVLEILSADLSSSVTAGESAYLDIVVKNRGYERLDDVYVKVSSEDLGISKTAYYGDLTATDDCDDCDNDDAQERRIYFDVPASAASGAYTLKVEAYTDDVSTSMNKNLVVSGSEQRSEVLVPISSKEVAVNDEVTYDLLIINRGNGLAVYEVIPESVSNLIVSVDSPIVTVQGGTSQVVKVTVRSANVQGSYSWNLNVESDGELVDVVTLQTKVVSSTGSSAGVDSIVILTIVLVIVFVVLLIVLIVLLSRKPRKEEEFGESYY
ncbi:MAG: hypothetical protein ABIH72_00195 [archaeon]